MAAVTPSSPNVEWAWPQKTPIRTDSRSASPPLELQLLPPTSLTASESPWGLDPLRLQQLMMGSAPGFSSANAPSACSSVRDLGALFDENGASQPLPSGWERCLDLQSGEVFLKKSDGAARVLKTHDSSHGEQHGKEWKQGRTESGRWPEVHKAAAEHRPDWSNRWPGEMTSRSQQGAMAQGSELPIRAPASLVQDADGHGSPDREVLCLDLDLRLTTEKRCSKASTEDQGAAPSPHASTSAVAGNQSYTQESVRPRTWEQCGDGGEKPARILDMARESTMATAVCSKCLMYVLLRKSCPICPRCSVPIALDGTVTGASPPSRKRSRVELSWDALSLSTGSSR